MIFMFLALLMLNQKFDQAQASLLAPDLTAGTKRSIKQTCLHGRTLSPCACDPKDQSSKLPRALTVQKIDQAACSLALCHCMCTIQKINQASSHAPLLYYQRLIKQDCLHARTLSPRVYGPKDQSSKLQHTLAVQKRLLP